MRRAQRLGLLLVWAGALLGCGDAAAPGGQGGSSAAPTAGPPAPDFTLPSLAGESVTLSALKGKTVIIDFWATWCPPCEFQVPELNGFYAAHRAAGALEVVGISIDVDGPEVVRPWAQEKGRGSVRTVRHREPRSRRRTSRKRPGV